MSVGEAEVYSKNIALWIDGRRNDLFVTNEGEAFMRTPHSAFELASRAGLAEKLRFSPSPWGESKMTLGSPSSVETRNIGNILFWILLAFILFNHTVRLLAGGGVPAGPTGIGSFAVGVDASVLDSLDAFRQALGHSLQYGERICPVHVMDVCGDALYGIRAILGLH